MAWGNVRPELVREERHASWEAVNPFQVMPLTALRPLQQRVTQRLCAFAAPWASSSTFARAKAGIYKQLFRATIQSYFELPAQLLPTQLQI